MDRSQLSKSCRATILGSRGGWGQHYFRRHGQVFSQDGLPVRHSSVSNPSLLDWKDLSVGCQGFVSLAPL